MGMACLAQAYAQKKQITRKAKWTRGVLCILHSERTGVDGICVEQATQYLNKLPTSLAADDHILITDPMLATGVCLAAVVCIICTPKLLDGFILLAALLGCMSDTLSHWKGAYSTALCLTPFLFLFHHALHH